MLNSLTNILKDLRVLYIEDEEATQKHVSEILTMLCRVVLCANNAKEGLEIYHKEKPDIIISDVDMPGINGIELVKIIRDENKKIPIILLTAHTDHKYLMEAIKLHLVDYITKPLDIKKLTLALKEAAKLIVENGEYVIKFISGSFYNPNTQSIQYQNNSYNLTAKENTFLKVLLKNRHRTVEIDELLNEVWNYDEGSESAIKSLVNKLRKKIGKESIINISGVGYRVILD
jgi:DNA-binding response OmpR family regulator